MTRSPYIRAHTMKPSAALALTLALTNAQAQSDIWYFGDEAGLDFSSGTPVALTGGASYSLDNSTTASDSAGNLLFYSNGESVWDATHTVMQNGSGLLGSNNSGQCALAVHQPGSSLYYLFTVAMWNGADGLRYSIVDMSLNGGLGDVTLKNVLLHTPSTERLEAVRNPNDGSWWLISHDWNNAQFRVYSVNAGGLNTAAVLSTAGAVQSGFNYDAAGQLTASPDGTLLCMGIYDQNLFQVFDFDATTGVVSNARDLPGYNNAWGCAFSPSNERLYLTKWYDNEVIQVDIAAGAWADVQSSALLVGNTSGNVNGWQAGFLQLGPDGKVYVAKFGQSTIAAVTAPDVLGSGCGFVDNAVPLNGGICNAGLCRTPLPDAPSSCSLDIELPTVSGCAWQSLDFNAMVTGGAPIGWQWDFGDGGTSTDPQNVEHTYLQQGIYTVEVIATEMGTSCSDTAVISVLINSPETAGNDTTIVVCDTDPPFSLLPFLSANADLNGTWYDVNWTVFGQFFDPGTDSSTVLAYAIPGVHCAADTAYINVDVQVCMGLKDVTTPTLVVSPNPARDLAMICSGHRIVSLRLIDGAGRTVLSATDATGSLHMVNVHGLDNGHYLLMVLLDTGELISKKLMVQHD